MRSKYITFPSGLEKNELQTQENYEFINLMKHPIQGNRGKIIYNLLLKYVAFEEIIAAFKNSILYNRLVDESM